jgi:hypothetical protein
MDACTGPIHSGIATLPFIGRTVLVGYRGFTRDRSDKRAVGEHSQ